MIDDKISKHYSLTHYTLCTHITRFTACKLLHNNINYSHNSMFLGCRRTSTHKHPYRVTHGRSLSQINEHEVALERKIPSPRNHVQSFHSHTRALTTRLKLYRPFACLPHAYMLYQPSPVHSSTSPVYALTIRHIYRTGSSSILYYMTELSHLPHVV